MWQQWLRQDWVRARSGTIPTVLRFAQARRNDMTLQERLQELKVWTDRLVLPGFLEDELPRMLHKAIVRVWWMRQVQVRKLEWQLDRFTEPGPSQEQTAG
jgi:hypothetical protein